MTVSKTVMIGKSVGIGWDICVTENGSRYYGYSQDELSEQEALCFFDREPGSFGIEMTGLPDGREIQEWEEAWANYMSKLRRLDELKAAGRYGFQLRMPGVAIMKAKQRLIQLDPDFCKRIGIG